MAKLVQLDPQVQNVLERAAVQGNVVRLQDRLDRDLYRRAATVLEALGGTWCRQSRGHVFSDDPSGAIAAAIRSGAIEPPRKKVLGQFFTPPWLADHVVRLAGITTGHRVLEPSAGAGALVRAALREGAHVTAAEIDEALCDRIEVELGRTWRGQLNVIRGDFLWWGRTARPYCYDAVIMNPPFAGRADIEHVMLAWGFVKPGGTLVAIMSEHHNFAQDRKSIDFRDWLGLQARYGSARSEPLPSGTFSESGTKVNTRLVVVQREAPGAEHRAAFHSIHPS